MQKLLAIFLSVVIVTHAEIRVVRDLEPIIQVLEDSDKTTLILLGDDLIKWRPFMFSVAPKKEIQMIALTKHPSSEELVQYELALEEYFEMLTIYPNRVIIIDAREDLVQSIHAICAKRTIACTAFHLVSS
jgi:hypothetical protein